MCGQLQNSVALLVLHSERIPITQWTECWIGHVVDLDTALARSKIPAGNQTPVDQHEATTLLTKVPHLHHFTHHVRLNN